MNINNQYSVKPSGVPWLGDIPAGWKMERLGVLYTHRNEKVSDKDFPPLSVTMKGVVPQLATAAKTDDGDNRKLVRKGDFAINSRSDRRGSCGISAYDGSVSLINTILTPRGQMSPAYFDWLFHTEAFADEFYKWGHGIVDDLWTTRWSEMKRIYIVRPPLPEQRAIADYLDEKCGAIDAAIAEAKKGIEEYKAWKKSLIFETVTGKRRVGAFNAEKRRGGEAEKMKPSGIPWIGTIPEGWKVSRVKNIADIQHGQDPKTEGCIPVYGSGDGSFKTCGEYKDGPVVLLGRKGATLHIPHYVVGRYWNVDTAFDVKMLGDANLRWFYYLAICFDYKAYMSQTTLPSMTQSDYRNMVVPVPNVDEQQAIADYLDEKCATIDAMVAEKEALIADLEAYKKSLIYETVTGKKEPEAAASGTGQEVA